MGLEIRRIDNKLEKPLCGFFHALTFTLDQAVLPYPLTDEGAKACAEYAGLDAYFALMWQKAVVGCGFLRGYEKGYDIPSLGIVIHPDYRSIGLGTMMMRFLHTEARLLGASTVMLKMGPDNGVALRMYTGLGYEFREEQGNRIVGFLDLEKR